MASPKAHGQAMMSTDRAALNAVLGPAPAISQPASVSADTPSTDGTNTATTRSTRVWIDALRAWACSASTAIWASWVWAPTVRASAIRAPDVLIEGIRRFKVWLPRALGCLTLDRNAYQQVVADPYMTGPALLIATLLTMLYSAVTNRGFDLVQMVNDLFFYFVGVAVVFAAGWVLTRRGSFTRTFRAMGFAHHVDVVVVGVELMRDGGAEALSMEAVANRASVSRASVYRRYANRVDLMEAVLLESSVGEEYTAVVVDQRKDYDVVQLHWPAVRARVRGGGLDLGTRVKVRLTAADPIRRSVDFVAV